MSYKQMAQVYDLLMKEAPYNQWAEFTKKMIKKYYPQSTHILDLGCGTGEITSRLYKEGYKMTGVDLSEDMLTNAQQKNSSVQWLKQDITKLEGLSDFDVVISYCDVINYITDETQVQKTFEHAYDSLGSCGLFLFDVHSVEHIRHHLYGQTFAEVYDDLSYIWFCDPGEMTNSVIHDLTFFVKDHEHYVRFDERHEQRVYEVDDLKNWLSEAGFQVLQVCADFTMTAREEGNRLFFVCQKTKKQAE